MKNSIKIYHLNKNLAKSIFQIFKLKITIRIIIILMTVNILISISILCHQSDIKILQKKNFMQNNYVYEKKDLLNSLNLFRLYNKIKSKRSSKPVSLTDDLNSDFKLNKYLINEVKTNGYKLGSFYEPRILINNEQKCREKNDSIIIVCLIHSHKNNFVRRKAMRDTWLSVDELWLSEFTDYLKFNSTNFKYKNIKIEHMFIIGSDEKNETFNSVKSESDLYKDIIMINTEDSYKNLIYKHLTAINWVLEYCLRTNFVVKMDDDVFVNIKSLSQHLLEKFSIGPKQSKFIYCNINEMAYPMRNNASKWYVDSNTYPFIIYPKYCEGFAYITNIATLKLMQEQSRIIPRFWIDDVYFTGLLLHGLPDIKWFNFKNQLKWSYYDFWDRGNTLKIYELYAKFLKFFRINAIDFYLSDFFVILHSQVNNKEINYNLVQTGASYISLNSKNSSLNTKKSFQFLNCLTDKDFFLTKNCSNSLFTNENKTFLYVNFYKFCINLWKKTIA